MIVPGSANSLLLAQGAATGYNLTKSLRFRSSASTYLNRTNSTTGTGQGKTWTYSFWAKLGTLGTFRFFMNAGVTATSDTSVYIDSSDNLKFLDRAGATLTTSQVFRDPSAWYHIIVAYDSTQATSSNRIKMYVNGSQVTAFGTATYPSLNAATSIGSNYSQYIGEQGNLNTNYMDAYMAEVNFIDGQALTPSSFGENNATTGVWQPKKYTGTYGTNGFYLPFTNTTSTTTLGNDFSGNSNNWTTNNFSLTAGSTYDSMTDVPTLTSATTANYAVLNPLASGATMSNGNLKMTGPSAAHGIAVSSIAFEASTSNFYCEVYIDSTNTSTNGIAIGLALATANTKATGTKLSALTGGWGWQDYLSGGFNFGASASYSLYNSGVVYATGDTLGIHINNGTLTFYKNGTSQGTATTGISGMVCFAASAYDTDAASFNFGQQGFKYTPPTGAVALNTYNLPTSTIVKGNTVMDATLYTGNGSTQTITNAAGFKPDLTWIKVRSTGYSHRLVDSVRGATKLLYSDLTLAETTDANSLTSFNSNGFSLGNAAGTNENAATFVGWQWQAGQGTTSSNTNGSITSTVSVNPTAGFSVVTYTAPASGTFTVGHGLGVAPAMIITKDRANTSNWVVWHQSLTGGTSNTSYWLYLNTTNLIQGPTTNFWGNSAPTSTIFGQNAGVSVYANDNYVAYCWAEIAGFSKFGSYTGNGSTDGTFVYTGFRPKYVLIKGYDLVVDWVVMDSARNPNNVVTQRLYPNLSNAEDTTSNLIDFYSNGFKLRSTNYNANGNNYVYAAFAENPFKNALAR